MTSVEMHHSLQEKLIAHGYPAERIDSYFTEKLLNEALYLFIDRYIPLLKQSEMARKKLHPLISNSEIVPAANTGYNISSYGRSVTLPEDYYKTLNEYITTSSDVVDVKPIDYDEYNLNRLNPFKMPYTGLVWRLELNMSDLEHELIPSSDVTIVKYRLRYITKPIAINITDDTSTNLREEDHEEVVNLAMSIIGNKPSTKNESA